MKSLLGSILDQDFDLNATKNAEEYLNRINIVKDFIIDNLGMPLEGRYTTIDYKTYSVSVFDYYPSDENSPIFDWNEKEWNSLRIRKEFFNLFKPLQQRRLGGIWETIW